MKRPPSGKRFWALAATFAGAILVWGASMWALKNQLRAPFMAIVQDEASREALSPWVRRARAKALSYDFVLSHPAESKGSPVLWNVVSQGDTLAYVEGSPSRPVVWSNPNSVKPVPLGKKGFAAPALGLVKKGGPAPLLEYLGSPLGNP